MEIGELIEQVAIEEEYSTYGRHIVIDLLEVENDILTNISFLEKIAIEGSEKSGATVKSSDARGNSALVLLSESHVAIHAYPDKGTAIVDAYTCGETVDPQVIIDYIIQRTQPKQAKLLHLTRGLGEIQVKGG